MSKNIQIKGKVYNNIESIKAEDADNLGTYVSFMDTTITSGGVTAGDILTGKLAYNNGRLIVGTNPGGIITEELFEECNQDKYGALLQSQR